MATLGMNPTDPIGLPLNRAVEVADELKYAQGPQELEGLVEELEKCIKVLAQIARVELKEENSRHANHANLPHHISTNYAPLDAAAMEGLEAKLPNIIQMQATKHPNSQVMQRIVQEEKHLMPVMNRIRQELERVAQMEEKDDLMKHHTMLQGHFTDMGMGFPHQKGTMGGMGAGSGMH